VRFLVDAALSRLVAGALRDAGHDAVHVGDLGLLTAEDEAIFALAAQEDRVLISADTDFGTILALRQETRPSVILLHRVAQRRPAAQAALLLANIAAACGALDQGSIVVIEEARMRVRRLPVGRED
jgi:predicted nuclease of predicted toxin-antitoxin system